MENNPSIIPNSIRCNSKEFPYVAESKDIYDSVLEKSQEDVNKDIYDTIKETIAFEVDNESIEVNNYVLSVKAGGILPKHLNSSVVDDEDICFNAERKLQLKDKEYDPVNMSGLGRVYLRRIFVDSWPDNTWLYAPINDVVYLLYSWHEELYAVYAYGKGLGLADNLVVKPANYNIEDIQSLVGERYLSFTEDEDSVYTITKPDGSTITSTELNNTNIYKLDLTAQRLFSKDHTIYYIQYDYDLLGQTITIPEGCTLSFEGGSIKNGTVNVNGAEVLPSFNHLLGDNLTVEGMPKAGTMKWDADRGKPLWSNGETWVNATGTIV